MAVIEGDLKKALEPELNPGWWNDKSYGIIPSPSSAERSSRRQKQRFWLFMVVFFVLALTIRYGYIYLYKWDQGPPGGDYFYYYNYALNILHFQWPTIPGTNLPTGAHPPLYPMILALGDFFGLTTVREQMFVNSLLGSALVVVLCMLARRITNEKIAYIVGVLGVLYPGLWVYDGQGLAESAETLCIGVVLLLTYRFYERPNYKRGIALGVSIGFTILARSEQITLLLLIGIPVCLIVKSVSKRRKLALFATISVSAMAIIAPWSIHMLTSFKNPEFLSTQSGITLETANCYSTYYDTNAGAIEGYWNLNCSEFYVITGDESQQDAKWRAIALNFIKHNEGRLPAVIYFREGRMWNFFRPFQMAALNQNEGWAYTAGLADLWFYWFMTPFMIIGIVALNRRKVPIFPLLAQVILCVFVAALIYGNQRYRAGSELTWVVAGGIGIEASVMYVKSKVAPNSFEARKGKSSTDPSVVDYEEKPIAERLN